jgi:hypothetical protein
MTFTAVITTTNNSQSNPIMDLLLKLDRKVLEAESESRKAQLFYEQICSRGVSIANDVLEEKDIIQYVNEMLESAVKARRVYFECSEIKDHIDDIIEQIQEIDPTVNNHADSILRADRAVHLCHVFSETSEDIAYQAYEFDLPK